METEIEPAKSLETNLLSLQRSASVLLNRVWTRHNHGSMPVNVWRPKESSDVIYEVEKPEGPRIYSSALRLLKDVTGYRRPPSFQQYFRLDRENSGEKANLLILLDDQDNRVLVPSISEDPKQTRIALDRSESQTRTSVGELDRSNSRLVAKSDQVSRSAEELSSSELPAVQDELTRAFIEELDRSTRSAKASPVSELLSSNTEEDLTRALITELDRYAYAFPSRQFGIDLVNRSHEVRKLLFAGFRGKMLSQRYDPDDVLQTIYMGLLARNKGKCPWDVRKSTFGYYVHMVINGVLTNYHRKESRREDREFVDIDDVVGLAGSVTIDAYGAGDELAREGLKLWLSQPEHGGNTQEGRLAVELIPFVGDGYTRREIVQRTGLKETAISKALAHLRRWSAVWAEEIGVVVQSKRLPS